MADEPGDDERNQRDAPLPLPGETELPLPEPAPSSKIALPYFGHVREERARKAVARPSVARVAVDEVIRDRCKKYEETKDPKHLAYEHAFKRELRKKSWENPEIRRNYFLDDTVEEGHFVSRERLLSCARGVDIIIP
jgi:hypothetical protein